VTDTFAAIGPELHAKLVDVVARNRLPGAVAGVVHRNELAWSAAIFEPLAGSLQDRRATGYRELGLSGEPDPAPLMPPVWAEGGLWSDLRDMARWVAFQLGAYRDRERAGGVLSAATLVGTGLAWSTAGHAIMSRPHPDSVPGAENWGVRAAGLPAELSAYGVGDTLDAALEDLAEGIRALLADGPIPAELTGEIAVTIGDAA
jgi:CubicO group peptidase (beta-lactamase class C family)